MTTEELFDTICNIRKEKEKVPELPLRYRQTRTNVCFVVDKEEVLWYIMKDRNGE